MSVGDGNPRKRIVSLIFVLYMLYLMEGALRKWLFPQWSQLLFFMRDPIVLIVYTIALRSRILDTDRWLVVWVVAAIVLTPVGLVGLMLSGLGPVSWILATRSYWLYLPLAAVISASFRQEDVARFVRANLILSLPMAVLVGTQYFSPMDAFVNRGMAGDAPVAMLTDGIVRPYGVFTYTTQQVIYMASVLSLTAVGWVCRARMKINITVLVLGTVASLIMLLLSGSRTSYALVLQLLGVLLLVAATSRSTGQRLSAVLVVVMIVGGGALLFGTVFDTVLEAMLLRQEQAVESEGSTLDRALGTMTSFTGGLATAPLIGHGLGIGTTTISALTGRAVVLAYGENEWERVIQELGPIFGLTFIGLRVWFVFYLFFRALFAARAGRPEGLTLLGFCAVILLNGTITFSTIVGFVAWLFAGLVLAVTRRGDAEGVSASTPLTKRGGSWPPTSSGSVVQWKGSRARQLRRSR